MTRRKDTMTEGLGNIIIVVFVVLFFVIFIYGVIAAVKYNKKRNAFIATHVIKCKRCGTTDTVYICMKSSSTSTSFSKNGSTSRSTTYRGHDKFCCNKCKANHYIENGDWIDNTGNNCNDEAKKLGLQR